MYFSHSLLSTVEKQRGPSFEQTESFYPRMLCAKFGWNWPSGSGEEDETVKKFKERQTGDSKSEKLARALISGEPNNLMHPHREVFFLWVELLSPLYFYLFYYIDILL